MFPLDRTPATPSHLLKELLIGKESRDRVSTLLRILLFENQCVNAVVKDLGKVRLKGSRSYTAWAVGFLTPNHDYPGFDVFVSKDG